MKNIIIEVNRGAMTDHENEIIYDVYDVYEVTKNPA